MITAVVEYLPLKGVLLKGETPFFMEVSMGCKGKPKGGKKGKGGR
jgi:hypothetical protein